ncbi:MAG: molybdopterin-dependent oxidoreductase [Desulfuromusa sp.]|nr:molybdopterin-dependent oxidoreductase [Desulfuromusa sp.]
MNKLESGTTLGADEEYGYTFCDGCNHVPFCGIRFTRRGDVVTHVESWPGCPAGPLCSKGYATLQRLYHPDRLKYPMKRTNPKGSADPGFVRISWDEAYDTITGHMKRIKEEHGPHSVFFYVGDPKEPRAAVQRLAATYGSVNYGCESSTACRRAAQLAELLTYGFPTLGNLPSAETKVMLIWGTNPAYSGQPYMCHGVLADAKERGVKFIVVDPRTSPMVSTLSDIHLAPRPGTDAALAAGMMHVIFKENLEDKEFCEKWIHGLNELKAYVADFSPERVETLTGVPAEKLIEAARLYGSSKPGGLMTGSQGTTHNTNATNNHRALLMVPAVCGYVDTPGGIVKPTNPLEHMGGIWADGPPAFSLREKMLSMAEHRLDLEEFPVWAEKIFEVETNHLVEWAKEGKVKAFLGWGLNTMIWAQSKEYQKAIQSLEFSMTVDYFYRPWSHDYVDIILPAAMNFERKAPFAVHGRTIYGRTPVPPQGECREDWQIALEIGHRLGYEDVFFGGDAEAACDEILKLWDLDYATLREHIAEGITIPAKGPEVFDKYEKGMIRPDGHSGFPTPTGKIEAFSTILEKHGYPALPEYKDPLPTSDEYPLVLLSGARLPFITHSKWRDDSPWLLELQKEPLMDINVEDAAARGLKLGDAVFVKTAWGEIQVKVKPTVMMPPGVVGMMHGWAKANVNDVIPREFDPISGYPPFKETPCEVLKVAEA